MEQGIKQEIEDQEFNVENISHIKSEIDMEEHPLFYPKTEPNTPENLIASIKTEHEQDLDMDVSAETSTVDPLAVDPQEDDESCKQSEDSEKQIDLKSKQAKESVINEKYLLQSQSSSLTLKKLHECTVCKKTYSTHSLLVRHSRTPTGERPYECTVNIEEHTLFYPKTEPNTLESTLTSIKTEHEQDLDVDVSAETSTVDPLAIVDPQEDAESCKQSEDPEKQVDFKSKPAEESVIDKKSLLQSQSPSKKFHECTVCKKTYSRPSLLVRHSRSHTGERPYECTVCKKKFSVSSSLFQHSRIHTEKKSYECTVCKKKFLLSSELVVHLRVHTGEKPYECTVCEKKFSQSSGLIRHTRTHTGEKPYECSVCKKKFVLASYLTIHSRIHTGEKPYECTVCEKKFSQFASLEGHSRVHTGEKPYECAVCKKKFARSSQLTSHLRTHTGEKPYECIVCKKKYSKSSYLVRHSLIHTGENR